jgi:hypothetical protein
MGAPEGKRLAGVPQLPLGGFDGYHQAVATRFGRTPTLAVHRPKDLHRLPQGHRAQAARYEGGPGLAVNPPSAGTTLPDLRKLKKSPIRSDYRRAMKRPA